VKHALDSIDFEICESAFCDSQREVKDFLNANTTLKV